MSDDIIKEEDCVLMKKKTREVGERFSVGLKARRMRGANWI
jgi:hypothetical protein